MAAVAESFPPESSVYVPGGTFRMGSDNHYPEEAPVHPVAVSSFRMDPTAVTNEEFARFIAATGYVTVAERPLDPAMYPGADPAKLLPGGLVFRRSRRPVDLRDFHNWWDYLPGASWRHPLGPASSIEGKADLPVVQVTFEDAEAFAVWAGKQLPTEAEWEYAARGGLEGKDYAWGEDFAPGGRQMANTWQGEFPWQNFEFDGFEGMAPVRSFPPNGYGLYEMTGNTWEWTCDWYRNRHKQPNLHAKDGHAGKGCCIPQNPRGPSVEHSYDPCMPESRIPRKVIKGGSYLCAPNYCRRYRPAARHAQMIDTATCHLGFRCVVREPVR
jgi:formylglycine-generating enzyme